MRIQGKMADKHASKPCKRKKSDTLEAAMKAGLALLEPEQPPKRRKLSGITIVKTGTTRQTHTPYRPRRKVRKCADNQAAEPSCSQAGGFLNPCDLDEHDVDDQLEQIISHCKDLFGTLNTKSGSASKTWSIRMADLQSTWEESRSSIFEFLVQLESLPDGALCSICFSKPGIVRCNKCKTRLICHECDKELHLTAPFHDRQAWINGIFSNILPTQAVNENGDVVELACHIAFVGGKKTCTNCGSQEFKATPKADGIIVITTKGRFDLFEIKLECGNCSNALPLKLEDILECGYWPASPSSFSTLFEQELFVLWDAIQKRMPGCSETSFIRSLGDVSIENGRNATINPRTFVKSFREWKYCKHEMDILQAKNWLKCPCCSVNQHSCHVDGNMKLYRYKSSGRKQGESYYGDKFIASNKDVDTHLAKVYKHSNAKNFTDDGKCGETNWRAAGNKAKTKARLDETGLEIAGCRHGFAQWAVNMFQGEIYGYADYLRVHKMIPNNVKYMWEDIICKYWKWAKNLPENTTLACNMKPALSVMHAKAHNWSCQVLWGGRWQEGSACSTGEEVEQINSYVSRLCNSTKYMLPEVREECITEHVLAWNKRKTDQLAESLCRRYVKTVKLVEDTSGELDDVRSELKISNDVDFGKWKEDIQKIAKQMESNSTAEVNELEELYILCQQDPCNDCEAYMHALSRKVVSHLKTKHEMQMRKENLSHKLCVSESASEVLKRGKDLLMSRAIKKLQCELEMTSFSIVQKKASMGKLTDSSKMRTKLRKKIAADHSCLERYTKIYNQLQVALYGQGSTILEENDAISGSFPWTMDDGSVKVKCKVVEKHEVLKRCQEELILLKNEMVSFLQFYRDIMQQLQREIDALQRTADTEDKQESTEPVQDEIPANNMKYTLSDKHREAGVIKGEVSIKKKGLDVAARQINKAIHLFSRVTNGDYTEFLLDEEIDKDMSEMKNDDEDFDNEDEDDDNIDVYPPPVHFISDDEIPSNIAASNAEGTTEWLFPENLSQSTILGRNGSNACSIISLLIADCIKKADYPRPAFHESLPQRWIYIICKSMSLGNRVYDLSRETLPSRYLSVAEAAVIMPDIVNVNVSAPLPVRITDEHEPSTLQHAIHNMLAKQTLNFSVFIVNEQSVLFVAFEDRHIMLIDTHRHGANGAYVLLGNEDSIHKFIPSLAKDLCLKDTDFGNLTPIEIV